jgi:hypothetical protein
MNPAGIARATGTKDPLHLIAKVTFAAGKSPGGAGDRVPSAASMGGSIGRSDQREGEGMQ